MKSIVTIDPQNPGGFAPLLQGSAPDPFLGTPVSYQVVRRRYSPETILHVAAINPAARPLMEKFAGEALQEELEILHYGKEL